MDLTKQNFCPNVKNNSDALRTSYICGLNGQICPKVDYSSGKALPSAIFLKNGCPLNKKDEPKKIEKIEKVEIVPEEPKEVKVQEPIKEDIKEEIEKVEEVKEVKTQPKKTTNKKKNYKKNK